jgi:RHS repeat-associated protein
MRPGPSYFPWGEPRGTNPQDAWSYASYWTDSTTGLDYANNRYYANAYGRFMTPDPYKASGAPSDPQSWNRYTYTVGDPVNRLDATGLDYTLTCGEDSEDCGGFIDINQNVCITIDNVPNPLCGYPIYGFQGPGGGASGPKFGIAHKPGSNVGPAGYSGAIALLQNASAQCLKDLNAASANAATSTLQGTTIDYTLGVWPTVNANGTVVSGTPSQSYSNAGNNFIDLNLNFGWLTPTNVLINGPNGPFYENYLADVGQSIGDPNLTNTQYWELVLLHELGHLLGVPQEPPGSPYNTNIFNDCIKGH